MSLLKFFKKQGSASSNDPSHDDLQPVKVIRRLKTRLRSTMNQARLNWCMILHIHQDQTDLLDIQSVANEFGGRNASRHSMFGVFV